MSTIIHIVVDVTLSASWWVIRKATYGIYSGATYLVWGSSETEQEIRQKKINERLENIETMLSDQQKNDGNKMKFEIIENDEYEELPPSYTEVIKKDNEGFEIVK